MRGDENVENGHFEELKDDTKREKKKRLQRG